MGVGEAGLDDFFSGLVAGDRGAVATLPDGVSITFELSGAGGGVWTLFRDVGGEVGIVADAVQRPDCRLACSVEVFHALVQGRLSVRRAFVDDVIKVAGDVGLVWRLQKILVSRTGP